MKKSLLLSSILALGLVSCSSALNSQKGQSPDGVDITKKDTQNYRVEIYCKECSIRNLADADPTYRKSYQATKEEGTVLSFSIKKSLNPDFSLADDVDFKCDTTDSPIYTYDATTGSLSFALVGNTTINVEAGEFPVVTMEFTDLYMASQEHTIGFGASGTIKKVDWGDGTIDQNSRHVYAPDTGVVTISVYGDINSIALSSSYPFYDNQYCISKIVFSDKITKIPNNSFTSCNRLTQVTFPNKLESIGDFAFEASGIQQLILPKTLRSIGYKAFNHCDSIYKIEVDPENPYYESDYSNCLIDKSNMYVILSSIGNIDEEPMFIPDKAKGIADFAFRDKEYLEYVYIPNSVTYIGEGAFYGCSSLKTISFPKSLEYIGHAAFYGCYNIKQFDFSQCRSLPTIEEDAFDNDFTDYSVVLPVNTYDTGHLFEQEFNTRIENTALSRANVYRWDGDPENYSYTPVATIICDANEWVAYDLELPVTFTAEVGVTVDWGDGTIDDDNFSHTYSDFGLYVINIFSNKRGAFGLGAFSCTAADTNNNYLFTSIILRGYTYLGVKNALKSLGIKMFVFSDDRQLYSEEIFPLIDSAFAYCSKLPVVELPDYITRIGAGAFQKCTVLRSVIFNKRLNSLLAQTCFADAGLKKIVIPRNLQPFITTTPINNPFLRAGQIEAIELDPGATANQYYEVTNNSLIAKFDYTVTVGTYNFPAGTLVTASNNTVVPYGVTWIGQSAFASLTGINTIELPDTCTGINGNTFNKCTNLTNLIIRYNAAVITRNASGGKWLKAMFTDTKLINGQGAIYVPEHLLEEYTDTIHAVSGLENIVVKTLEEWDEAHA